MDEYINNEGHNKNNKNSKIKKIKTNKNRRIITYGILLFISVAITSNLIRSIVALANTTESTSITISAAGDFTLGNYKDSPYEESFDHEVLKQNYNYDYFLENIKSEFEKDDLTIVNLEGPLTNAQNPAAKQFAFKGGPDYVYILKNSSVESVNLANNHSYDYGEEGYNETKNILSNNNITYFGNEDNQIVDIKGIKVALLGYKGWDNSQNAKNKIKEDLDYANKNSDLMIVSFHWGEENADTPTSAQKDLGRFVIDNGADLVLGHHPHVVQGVENYNGKYIVYSLGNFCFGGNKNPKDKDTFIFKQTFNMMDKEHHTSVVEIVPCKISSSENRNDYKPIILEGTEKERVANKIDQLSKKIK